MFIQQLVLFGLVKKEITTKKGKFENIEYKSNIENESSFDHIVI